MGDEVQAIKAGLLEVADLVVVNKGDKPGAQRTAAQLRAMLVASAGRDSDPSRPRPKRPEILITTASTGLGVPELLTALDRHRAAGRADVSAPARLARAEAQVWAVVVDRLRGRLHEAANVGVMNATLDEVANHSLDPYSAADRLLAGLVGTDPGAGTSRPGPTSRTCR